jgi:hypothetical protein
MRPDSRVIYSEDLPRYKEDHSVQFVAALRQISE